MAAEVAHLEEDETTTPQRLPNLKLSIGGSTETDSKNPDVDAASEVSEGTAATSSARQRRLQAKVKSTLSLLFSDVIEKEFSPRVQPSPLSPVNHTGKTPRALAFSLFESTDIFTGDDLDSLLPRSKEDDLSALRAVSEFHKNEIVKSQQEETKTENDADADPEICPWFLRGGCRFRKNCRLSHDIGGLCPYCGDPLPDTWTQQSKHLRRCWESRIEAQELELSLTLSCELCGTPPATWNGFALQQNCQHVICVACWRTSRSAARGRRPVCLVCGEESEAVMERDRMFFEPDRKSKAFGLFAKKRSMARSRYSGGGGGGRGPPTTNQHHHHPVRSGYYGDPRDHYSLSHPYDGLGRTPTADDAAVMREDEDGVAEQSET